MLPSLGVVINEAEVILDRYMTKNEISLKSAPHRSVGPHIDLSTSLKFLVYFRATISLRARELLLDSLQLSRISQES